MRRIFIADRVGGEGLRSRRPFMGRDIDYLVVVEGGLEEARRAASEIEDLMNKAIGRSIREDLRGWKGPEGVQDVLTARDRGLRVRGGG